jgi:NitT/TauT family transport system substrate-binding protein
VFAATVLLLGSAAGCGNDKAKESTTGDAGGTAKLTLTLNWVPYGEHAPFYYGLKKGYYRAGGIDLTIKPGNGSGNVIKQVDQKQTDVAWADTPVLLRSITTGMKIKSVGVYLQKGPTSIEFLADKNIKSPADLKGKTVGGTPGDAIYATFPAWLKANGVNPAEVKVVNVDAAGKIAALAENKVDAIQGFFHDQAPTIEGRTGKKVDYLLYADWGMNLLGTGIVVHQDTLKAKSDLIKRFVKATQKSWADAAKDVPGAVDAMAELAQNEPPKEVLTKQLNLCLPLLDAGSGAPGVNTGTKWTETIDVMAKNADLKDPGSPSKYWDGSYAGNG